MASSQPGRVFDGTMVSGTPVLTIDTESFILNNFKVSRAVNEAMDDNQYGSPQRLRKTQGLHTWTAEMQLASASTTWPLFGDTFTVDIGTGYGSEKFVFDPPDYEADNQPGSIRVIPAKGWVSLTGTITTSTP